MLTRDRIEAIRAMVDLQAKRHAELGGPESLYQVAINPSELAYLLDSERARRVGEAVLAEFYRLNEQGGNEPNWISVIERGMRGEP